MLLRASHVIKTASLASSRAAFFGTAAATRDAASADPPWKDTFATKPSADVRQGLRKERKNDRELEIDARWNKLEIPAMDVRGLPDQFWQECAGHARVRTMARHHHIYEHVFEPSGEGEAMETKRLMSASAAKNLNVSYGPDLATDNVHRGNILAAAQTSEPPRLNFSVGNGELYTVLMVSPDGLRGNGSEVLAHWVLTNVKDSADLASASCAAEYLPAIPLKGTGYHRYAFVLLQQHMSSELDLGSASSLTDRFVCVPTLMSEHRMKLRGLSFFQSTWDKSVDGNWENLVSSS